VSGATASPWSETPELVDSVGLETQRAEQSWHYALVATGIWICMSIFLLSRGYLTGAGLCGVQTLVMMSLMLFYRRKTELPDRRRFTNLFLGFSCMVIFLVAVAHPEISIVLLFLPLGIVMAAQVLGVRRAVPWLGVNLAAFVSFELLTRAQGTMSTSTRLDGLVLTSGVALVTFLSCYQSERLFRNRTTSLVELSSKLHRLATTDSLTGLMNRHKFQERLAESLRDAEEGDSRLALLSIDMDGFKGINDTLGHLVGDDTLREIAERLRDVAGAQSVFRLGGDEFCVLVSELDGAQQANDLAVTIHESLCRRYELDDAEFQLGASIGVALYPEHAETSTALLAFADTAMYHAKSNMLGVCGYESGLTEELVAVANMKNLLAAALDRDEFFLVYQPQTELSTGVVVGVEALLRWRSDGKVVSPGQFIPMLEQTRLILPVGRWLMREVCRQLRDWTDRGFDVRISVNVSVVQFHDDGFADSVTSAIDEFGVDPSRLDFEVIEGVLIENISEVVDRLLELKQHGATVSIDDFGTGYSSLAYLRQLPLDKLKIDREFVKDFPHTDDGTIAANIIALAKSLDLEIVAEGVETQEQLEFLISHRCDSYQGFLHSRPMEPTEAEEYLQRRHPEEWTFAELEAASSPESASSVPVSDPS